MPVRIDLPIISPSKPLDAALTLLRSAGLHALVVSGPGSKLRLLTSKQILLAKAKDLKSLNQVRRGLVVAKPAISPARKEDLMQDVMRVPELFGRSRARYILVDQAGSRATLISRRELFTGIVSAGAACICSKCGHCKDSPPAYQGGPCPSGCGGKYDCY